MNTLWKKSVCIAAFLHIPFAVTAEVFFHSDFECGETWLAEAVRPGAKTVELCRNDRLDEWPLRNGCGLIEANLPSASDSFRYAQRQGTTLEGVTGITRIHPLHAGIQTGSLGEWLKTSSSTSGLIKGNVRVCTAPTLFGAYCLEIPFADSGIHRVYHPLPEGRDRYVFRFYARFSRGLLASDALKCPIAFLSLGNVPLQRLVLRKEGPTKPARLVLFPNRVFVHLVNRTQACQPPTPLEASHRYCVEYSVTAMSEDQVKVSFSMDGVFCDEQLATYTKFQGRPVWSFQLGKLEEIKHFGKMWVDEVVAGNTAVGCIPRKPRIELTEGNLQPSPFHCPGSHHRVSQWQISRANQWLTPLHTTGETRIFQTLFPATTAIPLFPDPAMSHPLSLTDTVWIPVGVAAGDSCFARVRHAAENGNWSEWSVPFRYEPTPGASTPSQLPVVQNVYLSRKNIKKPSSAVVRNEWVNLVLHLHDSSGWKNLGYADVVLTADPENNTIGLENRLGKLKPDKGMAFGFSIMDSTLYWRANAPHPIFNQARGIESEPIRYPFYREVLTKTDMRIWANIRLPENMQVGQWALRANTVHHRSRPSPPVSFPFRVVEHVEEKEPVSWTIIAILAGLTFLLGISLTMAIRKRPKARAGSATDDSRADEILLVTGPHAEKIEAARDYVLANYHAKFSTADIADSIHVSVSWLSRNFTKATGKTLSQYIAEVRLDESKKLLTETEKTVTEIAYACGFNSLDYFLQAFRNAEKCSPGEFRRIA